MVAVKPDVIQLIVPAQAKYLAIVRQFFTAIAQLVQFDSQTVDTFGTAIGEACSNVVRHAYPKDSRHSMGEDLLLRFLIYPTKVEVVVKDMGHGFDPLFAQRYIPRQDVGKPERLKMGLRIIQNMVDEMEIDSQIGKGTQIRMTKYRSAVRDSNPEDSLRKEITHE